ncbi:hypothetical protein HJC23_010346 [Cyclotella cryptica]|uniref:tRNA-5-taurinomethyluridine 2-sulfurtransferase n=1 Tax=Cyclotella cryptica TaxID=29204 RepID=A0ABD3QNL1_9STRA|eukprot:CCRYP_003769-RA/>CCRYP_003769-RA protein AED:0.03 eAED:-0.02 QI:0/-1/0/1/-1/1/1/0/588
MNLMFIASVPWKLIRAKCNFSSCSRNNNVKIVVAMSGGVDSSVAAYLLQNLSQKPTGTTSMGGFEVVGLHMSNWNELDEDADDVVASSEDRDSGKSQRKPNNNVYPVTSPRQRRPSRSRFCEASEKEYNDSQSVAHHLSIPLHRVSFASEYWIQVFEPFVESLSTPSTMSPDNDRTDTCAELTMPNPDFNCNTFIKFGAMKDYAVNKLGGNFVATGHYAQLWHRGFDLSPSNKENNSRFFEWMTHTSMTLQQQVHASLSGRPEEEWLLRNCTQPQSNSHIPMLLAGADRSKDQTYFLSGVKTECLRNVIFPLGHLEKKQSTEPRSLEDSPNDYLLNNMDNQLSVRDIALRAKIPTASKKESMGICFIGKRNFGRFVSQYLPDTPTPGKFVDVDTGEIVGYHRGSMHYTIGQGAKISGGSTKYFVCGKGGTGRNDNTVFVCNDTHHPSLYTDELYVDFKAFNWIGLGESINDANYRHVPHPLIEGNSIELLARTRHLQPLAPCSVTWQKHQSGYSSSSSFGKLIVKFHRPMRAITPGQIVALYAGTDGLICLGGGPICGRGKSLLECGLEVPLSMLHPSGHNDLSLICT